MLRKYRKYRRERKHRMTSQFAGGVRDEESAGI
jgi:hypothetical protein